MGRLLPKGINTMRMFFTLDSNEAKYSEIDISKISAQPGDRIVVSSEESLDYVRGRLLLDNIQNIDVVLLQPGIHNITKPISALVFYEKIPKSIEVDKNRDSVCIKITI